MDTSATAKEYNALLVELNTVKNERTKLDETMVQQLDEVERLETLVAESEASAGERESVVATAAQDVKEREAEISERVSELQSQRDEAAADIPLTCLSCTTRSSNNSTVRPRPTSRSKASATKSFLAALAACKFPLRLFRICTPDWAESNSAPTAAASCCWVKKFGENSTRIPRRTSSGARRQPGRADRLGRTVSSRTDLTHQPAAIDSLQPGQHPSSH